MMSYKTENRACKNFPDVRVCSEQTVSRLSISKLALDLSVIAWCCNLEKRRRKINSKKSLKDWETEWKEVTHIFHKVKKNVASWGASSAWRVFTGWKVSTAALILAQKTTRIFGWWNLSRSTTDSSTDDINLKCHFWAMEKMAKMFNNPYYHSLLQLTTICILFDVDLGTI